MTETFAVLIPSTYAKIQKELFWIQQGDCGRGGTEVHGRVRRLVRHHLVIFRLLSTGVEIMLVP